MKRIAVLLVVLLTGLSLYGCGANGTTSSSSSDNGSTATPTGTPSGPVTAFTIKLVDKDALVSRGVNTGTGTAVITGARVVIRQYTTTTVSVCRNPLYDASTDTETCPDGVFDNVQVNTGIPSWKDIQDVAYGSQITVNIPQGSGYTLDVIGNIATGPTGTINIMSYGTTSLVTVPTTTATIIMTKVPEILNMSVNDPVSALGTLVVSLNSGIPFNNAYQLALNYNGIVDLVSGATLTTKTINTSSRVNSIPVPSSITPNKQIDVSAVFTLNSAFVKSTDTPGKWTRTFPDSAYSEQAFSVFNQFIPTQIGL
jgi:hypothetical protein